METIDEVVQNLVEYYKKEIPSEFEKKLLHAMAEETANPTLYKPLYRVKVTRVTAIAYLQQAHGSCKPDPIVKMPHHTQTLVLEINRENRGQYVNSYQLDLIDRGEISEWLVDDVALPYTIEHGYPPDERDNGLTIVHSITPYVHKRSRE